MILPIVQLSAPILRRQTRRLTGREIASPQLRQTVESMRETMLDAPGVGLAAPQIGLDIRVAVLEDRAAHIREDDEANLTERSPLPFNVFINATYEPIGDETRDFFEGCLSMHGWRAIVRRHHRVRATWTDLDGKRHTEEFRGWAARIVQHEIDHLDGVVYVDRCMTRSLMTTEYLATTWSDVDIPEIRELFEIRD